MGMLEGRGSGRLEDSPLAQPEGARPRVTWETTSRSRTIRAKGQPEERIEGDTEGPEFRATWRTVNRHRRRMRGSRRLGAPSPAKPEMQDEGKPEACIESVARGEVRKTGRPGESPKPATRKDAKFGATRKSIAGTAKGLRKRGNLWNRSPGAAKERGVRGDPETRN
jgi:hypothetical protein